MCIRDSVRTLSFSIADGATPGNTGRGYVLRRVLRRAVKYAYLDLNIKEPVIYKLVSVLVETMSSAFPEIKEQQSYIEKIIKSEESSFLTTLENGIKEFKNRTEDKIKVSSEDAFFLFDTCGFPLDLTELLAREQNLTVDYLGFNLLMNEQKNRARSARKTVSQLASDLSTDEITEFIGYENDLSESKIISIIGESIILDQTPFYAEMGGQESDIGKIVIAGETYKINKVEKLGDAFLHFIDEDINEINIGESVVCSIAVSYTHLTLPTSDLV